MSTFTITEIHFSVLSEIRFSVLRYKKGSDSKFNCSITICYELPLLHYISINKLSYYPIDPQINYVLRYRLNFHQNPIWTHNDHTKHTLTNTDDKDISHKHLSLWEVMKQVNQLRHAPVKLVLTKVWIHVQVNFHHIHQKPYTQQKKIILLWNSKNVCWLFVKQHGSTICLHTYHHDEWFRKQRWCEIWAK